MMTKPSRAAAAPGKQSRRFERSNSVGIERDRTLRASLSDPSDEQQQISLDDRRAAHSDAEPAVGRAVATLDPLICPDCGDALISFVCDQLPLLRGCGYGEAQRTTRRQCRSCGWSLTAAHGAVKP